MTEASELLAGIDLSAIPELAVGDDRIVILIVGDRVDPADDQAVGAAHGGDIGPALLGVVDALEALAPDGGTVYLGQSSIDNEGSSLITGDDLRALLDAETGGD